MARELELTTTPHIGESLEEVIPPAFTYQDADGNEQTLGPSEHNYLLQQIKQKYHRLDSQKSPVRRRWQRAERGVKGVVSTIQKERFFGLVPFGKQTVQTLISHFWSRSLQTPDLFFGVEGEDEESQSMAPLQQANLSRYMEKDRVRQKLDKALALHGVMKGVAVFHVGYEVNKEPRHGPEGFVNKWETGQFQLDENGNPIQPGSFRDIEQKIYEGATVKIIDPYNFVFDIDNEENWDQCFKAHVSWWEYEDIAADANFSNYEELKDLAETRRNALAQGNGSLFKKKKKQMDWSGVDDNGRIEVVEVHGDIRLSDGTYLRNWTMVIGGWSKIIRFEPNPYFINPYVKWQYEETEDGWGLSPVDYILPLIDGSSILLSTGIEGAKMGINPPWLADESHFNQKKQFLTEGAVVKYRVNQVIPNQPPVPIKFDYSAPFPYVQQFESQAEATTGATRQLSGNVTTNEKAQTATEFQGLQVVGNIILDRLVDRFNLDAKLPVIRKIALINAMFNPEEKTVAIAKDDGTKDYQEVEKKVYFGNYNYIIVDNKSEIERKQNIQQRIQTIEMFDKDPYLNQRMNKVKIFNNFMMDMGNGDVAGYVRDDQEYVEFTATQLALNDLIQIKRQQALEQLMQKEGMPMLPAGMPGGMPQQDPSISNSLVPLDSMPEVPAA